MQYNFDEIINRENTNSVKYGVGKMMYPDLPQDYIPMWIADMDFACPQEILDAMKARLDKRILGYSMILDPEYFSALSAWMKNRHGWDVDGATSSFSPGVITALNEAVANLTKESDGIILNTPAYHPFDDAIKKHKRTPVYNPLINKDGKYEIDWKDFEEKAKDPNNTLYFLCNPHNPTGRVWTKEELVRIGEICFSNNVFVVSDEIHFDFIRKGMQHTVFATLFPNEKRIITCTAPSKTFNLAGNELSNIFFADPALQQEWSSKQILGVPNPLSIDACKAAYAYCGEWVDQLNGYLDENFNYMKKRIDEEIPNIHFEIPESTYLAWIDVSKSGFTRQELALRMVRVGLQIEYEDEFVGNSEGFVRINIACPKSVLEKAVDKLVAVLGKDAKPALKPLSVGDTLSDETVNTPFKANVSLKKMIDKNTLLLFLRYSGCPICRLDMQQLKNQYNLVENANGQVIVFLQSDATSLRKELKDENAYPFEIVCDPKGELYEKYAVLPAAGQMGLMGPKLMEKMAEVQIQKIEHGAYEGDEMQLPATFAVDADMKVGYVHYAQGLADTPSPKEIAEILSK